MPIFKGLTNGMVDDDVGFFFLVDKVAVGGDITRLGAASPTVVRRRTGTRPQVISWLQNWVVTVGFDDGRCWCWGRPPCTLDWGDGHRFGWGVVGYM